MSDGSLFYLISKGVRKFSPDGDLIDNLCEVTGKPRGVECPHCFRKTMLRYPNIAVFDFLDEIYNELEPYFSKDPEILQLFNNLKRN